MSDRIDEIRVRLESTVQNVAEIEQIRRDHIADPDGDPDDPHCVMCSDASYPIWPCDAAIVLAQGDALEAERDALASRLAAAEAARDHLETVIADAVSVGEMQGEDFRLMPWSSLNAALAAALAGSREQATTEGE